MTPVTKSYWHCQLPRSAYGAEPAPLPANPAPQNHCSNGDCKITNSRCKFRRCLVHSTIQASPHRISAVKLQLLNKINFSHEGGSPSHSQMLASDASHIHEMGIVVHHGQSRLCCPVIRPPLTVGLRVSAFHVSCDAIVWHCHKACYKKGH